MKTLLIVYIIYLSVISLITLLAYYLDKKKAQAKMYRTKEKVLIALSLAGGAYLGYPGMFIFRHKTKKWYFHVFNITGLIIHTILLILIIKGI